MTRLTGSVIEQEFDKSQLALAIARNQVGEKLPISDILASEGVPVSAFEQLLGDPVFTQEVKKLAKDLTEHGFGFQTKCRVMAEDLLQTKYKIIKNQDTPAAVRMKGIESLVKWADLEPKTDATLGGPGGPQFSINIVVPEAVRVTAREEAARVTTLEEAAGVTAHEEVKHIRHKPQTVDNEADAEASAYE